MGIPVRAAGIVLIACTVLPAAGAPAAIQAGWKTYHDARLGFSISYPPEWKVDCNYVYVGFGPDHEIHGVAFTIPESLRAGTNLSANMTNVSVESVPDSAPCDARRFIPEPEDMRSLNDAGRIWSTAHTQDAGAGNLYDIAIFALPGSSPCLAVRYFIHSTNIANYDPGAVKAFDRAALLRSFAKIRRTLRLKSDS